MDYSNVKIIRKNGEVHKYGESIFIARTQESEDLYQLILQMAELSEEKPA